MLDRADFIERQHGLVLRHFFEGEEQVQIAAERGVSCKAVNQVRGALVKLRNAAG